jgi:hypothetical protein
VPDPAVPLVLLHASGKGRQRLDLAVRFKLEKRGGWRVATGRLPVAPATSLRLVVPGPLTEVRLGNIFDRTSYETKAPNEAIETALSADGIVNLQWRPKVAEAQIDRSLTVNSDAVLDIREDGLRLAWKLTLEFRRGQRESFTALVPEGYLVEKVTGNNVRGFDVKPADGGQQVEVTLLNTARDQETLMLYLSRRGAVGQQGFSEFRAPVVSVADAALHHGRLTIRRSGVLDVRTASVAGLTRTDVPMDAAALAESSEESFLGLRPFQAYQFVTVPFELHLTAAPLVSEVSGQVQSVLHIAERDSAFESLVKLRVQGPKIYRVRMYLPEGLELERVVAPAPFEWAVTEENDRRLLAIYLGGGKEQEVDVSILGTFGPREADTLALPRLELLDVDRQEGDVVVTADPAFDVRGQQLAGCESVLLDRVHGWLADGKRPLARLALHYRTGEHGGQLRVTPRQPRVNSFTVTNVKVTDRAIEETILLEFTIREAGIRELSFLLPARMKDARVRVANLRQKIVEPASEPDASDPQVRFRLLLEDERMGEFRVVVEDDRLLANGTHTAPIPVVETGRTDNRYVLLENAGNDELVIDEPTGLEPLTRQQQQWRTLASLLGGEITQAYLVREAVARPRLPFAAKERAVVETVAARIGLAAALLVVDSHGAYRGVQEYRLDNRTEQFLEILLPEGAQLWTAQVAGEPVKPTAVPADETLAKDGSRIRQNSDVAARGADAPNSGESGYGTAKSSGGRRIRIPLVKTAAGDRDYAVVLKYGGQMPEPGSVRAVRFPLIRTVNINVELSQVRLRLPETHSWFNFGGSMRRTADDELRAGFLAYQTRQIQRLSQLLKGSDDFTKARATSNLKQLGLGLTDLQDQYGVAADQSSSQVVQQELNANYEALQEAHRQIAQEEQAEGRQPAADNRFRFNDLFESQRNTRSKNVVTEFGGNFKQAPDPAQPQSQTEGERFNRRWLESNQLQGEAAGDRSGGGKAGAGQPGRPMGGEGGASRVAGPGEQSRQGQSQAPAQQIAPGLSDEFRTKLQVQAGNEAAQKEVEEAGRDDSRGRAQRYQQRLEMQQQGLPQLQAPVGGPMSGFGRGDGQPQSAGAMGMGSGGLTQPATPAAPPPPGGSLGPTLDGLTNTAIIGEKAIRSDAGGIPVADPTPTNLASLDVELPVRGVEYQFSTPRGEVEITARAVSNDLLARLWRLAAVLGGIAVVALAARWLARGGAALLAGRLGAALLILGGLASVISGVLPLFGLAALLFGLALAVRLLMESRLQTAM